MAKFIDFWKREMVEKPGHHIHTAKFDRCVEHVKASGTADNPYAVCMAVLGDEALKSQTETEEEMKAVVDEYIKRLNITSGIKNKMDISGAGPVPSSLLARQDLEGTERTTKSITKHIRHEGDSWNLYSKKTGKLLGKHKTKAGAEAQEAAIEANKSLSEDINEERQGEQHYRDIADTYDSMADDEHRHMMNLEARKEEEHSSQAEDSLDPEEKETLAERIQRAQVKRQKSNLRQRNAEKSFKDMWRGVRQ